MSTARSAERARLALVGLIVVHVLIGLFLLFDPPGSDAPRYFAIATHSGVPYVDFPVEYPPVLVLVSKVLAIGSFDGFLTRVILLSLVCDLALALLILRTWGRRATIAYLVLSAPLLPTGLPRLDWLPTVLAVVAMAMVLRSRRQIAGGTTLAIATFTKLWPGLLVAIWIARRRWDALSSFCVAGSLGLAAWVGLAGEDGIRQVLSYRGARGWQIESLPGNVLVAFTNDRVHFERGAWRIGSPPGSVTVALLALAAAIVAALASVLFRAADRRTAASDAGSPALALVSIALVVATLLSPQFLVWLVPWAAIAFAYGERRAPALVFAAILVTVIAGSVWPAVESGETGAQVLYWLRNLLLVATALTATISVREGSVDADAVV